MGGGYCFYRVSEMLSYFPCFLAIFIYPIVNYLFTSFAYLHIFPMGTEMFSQYFIGFLKNILEILILIYKASFLHFFTL